MMVVMIVLFSAIKIVCRIAIALYRVCPSCGCQNNSDAKTDTINSAPSISTMTTIRQKFEVEKMQIRRS